MNGDAGRPSAPARPGQHHCDRRLQAAQGRRHAGAGRDDEIGGPNFHRIGPLLGTNGGQLGRTHPRPPQHPLGLKKGRRHHHRHPVAAALAVGFEQERDIEHHQPGPPPRLTAQECALGAAHQGMQDGLQPPKRGRIAEHLGTQSGAIDRPRHHASGKGRPDCRHRRAAPSQQPMNGGVGVMNRQAPAPQHAGGGAFALANRAGQTQDLHASTKSRRASSTSGRRPNQASKPGTACQSSIPRPSTVTWPRISASSSNSVLSGT